MFLASRNIGVNDTRLYVIDYSDFLVKGAVLTGVTITLPAGITSTKGAITLRPDDKKVQFFITGGVLNEAFTASVQATDNTGQIVHDTVSFLVVAP